MIKDDVEQLEDETAGNSEFEEKFRKIEADLIAQDHRAFPVLQAFFRDRRQWDRSDPRWQASWTAFIWWCVGGLASPAGAAIGLAAFLTLALTGWNAWEFRRQNEALAEQNAAIAEQNLTLKRQVDQQEADTLIVRRAQLLTIIYEEDCEGSADEKICVPRSHLRARQEAVVAFAEIERGQGSVANLSRVKLENTNLAGANLYGANLANAYLTGANLEGADLRDADLVGAIFANADLTGANLRDVEGLTQDKLNGSLGDSTTILPEGLNPPEHWKVD